MPFSFACNCSGLILCACARAFQAQLLRPRGRSGGPKNHARHFHVSFRRELHLSVIAGPGRCLAVSQLAQGVSHRFSRGDPVV